MAANTGAILQTDDGTLTAKFGPELRIRSTSPGLEEYLRNKNQWDCSTFQAVKVCPWKGSESLPSKPGTPRKISPRCPSDKSPSKPDGRRITEMPRMQAMRRDYGPHPSMHSGTPHGMADQFLVGSRLFPRILRNSSTSSPSVHGGDEPLVRHDLHKRRLPEPLPK